MQEYQAETGEILRRFMSMRISFPDCIAALDAALVLLIQNSQTAPGVADPLGSLHLSEIRALMLANNETVMAEMQKRALIVPQKQTN